MMLYGDRREWWLDDFSDLTISLLHKRRRYFRYGWCFLQTAGDHIQTDGETVGMCTRTPSGSRAPWRILRMRTD